MPKKLIQSIVKDVEGAETTDKRVVPMWLDTGNFALNYAISGDYTKGLPFGRVVDVSGDPSAGKSLLIYHLIANVQKLGGIGILDDAEDAYIREFGALIGIDNEELIRLNSLTVDEHYNKVFRGYKDSKGKAQDSILKRILDQEPDMPIVVALDSLALLSTKHEMDVGFDARDMSKASDVRKGIRFASDVMTDTNILYVISNHVIAKIGVLYGKKTTTPGGTGVPFQASVRLECRLHGKIKDESDNKIGVKSTIEVTKNKVSSPFRQADIEIMFEKGMDRYSGLLDTLIARKIVSEGPKRGYCTWGGKEFRTNELEKFISENEELLCTAGKKVVESVK
jgi:recombination protein RecA